MYQMKNFQTSADLSKNYYSFLNITRNFDGLNATFRYLINGPFQQIKLQTYCILYISYCKQYFHLADIFFPVSQKGKYFCSSASDIGRNNKFDTNLCFCGISCCASFLKTNLCGLLNEE